MSLQEILEFRRSVRYFDEAKELDTDKVRRCIELATLAPNSSNMQLWEFYHITDPEMLKKISHACLDQKATETAKQIVIFVTRRDLHRERSKAILEFEKGNIARYSPPERQEKRWKDRQFYYNRLMPFIYSRVFWLLGFFMKIIAASILFSVQWYTVQKVICAWWCIKPAVWRHRLYGRYGRNRL